MLINIFSIKLYFCLWFNILISFYLLSLRNFKVDYRMHLENLDSNKLVINDIASYYANKSILVTGATGYLGKVLAEKLLRSCSDLKKIYLLIRHKKGKKPSERLEEIINCKLFDEIKKLNINYKEKLEVVEGDLTLPKLGLSDADREKIIENVNIIFNSAATIRFDEPLEYYNFFLSF